MRRIRARGRAPVARSERAAAGTTPDLCRSPGIEEQLSESNTATLIDGRVLAADLRAAIAADVQRLRASGRRVALDAVLADPSPSEAGRSAAMVYADNQRTTCEALGIDYHLHQLPHHATYEDVAGRILLLNADERVTAIMLHLPVPAGMDTYRLQSLIAPAKDVEGVNPANIGNIVYGRNSLVPCTAMAVLSMVESTGINLRGKRVVCVGASDIVGKPVAVLMMQREATVVSCNAYTPNLADFTRLADVLVVAVGKAGLVTAEMVAPGAIVIDVGVNRITTADGRRTITGDVDFEAVRARASHITPVPGGVGPMTVTMLLRNTVQAALRHALPTDAMEEAGGGEPNG